ncbi:MAG TPA: hypothetical protein PK683_15210, partial [Leptospiraceae bacterium]|nr:hypothetical protein [Leptospiraceae bacterium]
MKYILFLFILFHCSRNDAVITSKAGSLSYGSYQYLKRLYYSGQTDEDAILSDLKDMYSVSGIATANGLENDRNYEDFLKLEKIGRLTLAGAYRFKELFKEEYGQNSFYRLISYFDISFMEEDALRMIKENTEFSPAVPFLKKKHSDVFIFTLGKKKISLEDLSHFCMKKELVELPALSGQNQKDVLKKIIEKYLFHLLNTDLEKNLKADESELDFIDYARTARLFTSAKYGFAEKGIYPTEQIRIKLAPKELFEHFHKMMHIFQDIDTLKFSAAVLKNRKDAEDFLNRLKRGEKFEKIAESFSLQGKNREMSTPHTIPGYDRNLPPDRQHQRNYIDLMALDLAKQDLYEYEPVAVKEGYAVIRIYEIKRLDMKLEYKDYRNAVEMDLERRLLNRQFEIDKKDALDRLQFTL